MYCILVTGTVTSDLTKQVLLLLLLLGILFTKLPWPGDSEGTFRSSSQAATCPPVYLKRRRLHTVPLVAVRQPGKL